MSEDLIRRSDAIKALQKEINKGIPPFDDTMGAIRCGVRLARNIIEDLPSADRPQGEWIECDVNDTSGYWKCSACGVSTAAIVARTFYNFCPFCGADMRGKDDE